MSGSISPMTFIPCICLYYFNISDTVSFPNISISLFDFIWLYLGISAVRAKITSTTILWNSIDLFHSNTSLTLMNWLPYELLSKFICILSIFSALYRVGCWTPVPSMGYLVSTNLCSLVCNDICSLLPVNYSSTYYVSWLYTFITISLSPVPYLLSLPFPTPC